MRAFRDSEDAKASLKETSNEVISSISTNANEFADKLATYWEESEDKPTIVAVGFGAILALYFIDSIVSAVDRLPLISNAFELIGIAFSGWTAYRYFLAGEKETMNKEVKNLASKVGIDL